MAVIGGNNNNRNKNKDEDKPHVDPLLEALKTADRLNKESSKVRIKQIDGLVKDFREYSKGFGIFKNTTLKNQNTLVKTIENNTKQLEKNLQNSKELIKSINSFMTAQKNNAVGQNAQKETKAKGSTANASKDNFDQKSRLERSIIGDEVTGYLSAIKKDTGRIVELLEKGISGNAPPPREGKKLDLKDMLGGGLMAALTAAMFAAENKKTGTQFHAAATAVPAVARTLAKVIEPVIDVAKSTKAVLGIRDAATAGRAAASIGQAATDARGKFTAKNILMGEQKVGTLGKIGAAAGLGATYARYQEGDTTGAVLQGISTALPLALAKTKFGKIANLASAGIDLGLLGRDKIKDDEAKVAKAEAEKAQEPASQIVNNTTETNVILREISNYFKGGGAEGTEKSASSFGGGAMALGALAVGGALMGRKAGIFSKLITPATTTAASGASTAGRATGALQGARFTPLSEAQRAGGRAPLLSGGARAAGAGGASAGASSGAKLGLGMGAKIVGKTALKALPFVGLGMGAYGAYEKTKEGDYTGAAIEAASGIASMIPVIGTAASIALQGVSATRDVMRATNEETNANLLKNNTMVTDNIQSATNQSNAQITATTDNTANALLNANAITNKSIVDNSAIAQGSIANSASTLTTTTNGLASSLTGASNTLLDMISKYSLPGMMINGTKEVAKWITGAGAPEADSNAQGSQLHTSRKHNMIGVYNAFLKSGMSVPQAKAMTAEIGRENDFGNDLWKTHKDDKNGKTNVGMMSWQNGRDTKLLDFLGKKGVLNKDGSIQRTQAALDAQAEFVMKELKGDYKKVGNKFLSNKDISYKDASKMLGKEYIGWAYDNEKYANGHARRDAHYTNLNDEIYHRGIKTPEKKVTYISQKEYDKITKAEAKPPMVASREIHDKWNKKEAERVKQYTKTQSGILDGSIKVGTAPKQTKSNVTVPMAAGNSNASVSKSDTSKGASKGADYDLDKICAYAYSNAKEKTLHQCAKYVRIALQQGDNKKQISTLGHANEWSSTLPKVGFVSVGNSQPRKGDIAHIPPNQYSKIGHVCIYTGSQWVSDFKQKSLNPYPSAVPYTIYRARSGYSNGSAIGSGEGTDLSDDASKGGVEGGSEGQEDLGNPDNLISKATTALSEGVAAIFNSEAMGEMREFIKGDVYKRPDNMPIPKAEGTFTKDTDELDPKRQLRGNGDNGQADDLLGALGGDDVLRQQKHADYDKVKRILGGTDEILRQEKHPDYDKIKDKLGGTNKILRQFDKGGKNAWIFNLLSQLGIGGDGILGEIIGVASGQKSIKDINLGNLIKIPNSPEGAFGGGFGGGLKQNGEDSDPIGDLASMGAFGGGFGGGINYAEPDPNEVRVYPSDEDQTPILNEGDKILISNGDGSIIEHKDGSFTNTLPDGRSVTYNEDGTVKSINKTGNKNGYGKVTPQESDASTNANDWKNETMVGYDSSMGSIVGGDAAAEYGFGGGFGGGLVRPDPSNKQLEDQQMEMAKQYVDNERKRSYEVMVQAPPTIQTPTNGGEARGKTPMDGLDSQLIVKNPDTIPHALAVAMLKNSM